MTGGDVDPNATIALTDLLARIEERARAWCEANGAKIRVASDAWHVYDILGAAPLALLAVIYWAGDDDNGQEVGICKQDVRVVLSRNRGLGAKPDGNLTGTETKAALFTLVDGLRAHMRGALLPEHSTSQLLEYRGTKPFTLPEGFPLDAYEMAFEIHTAIALQETP